MKTFHEFCSIILAMIMFQAVESFAPSSAKLSTIVVTSQRQQPQQRRQQSRAVAKTSLFAIGILKRKAKEADLRNYVQQGVEDHVMEKYKLMKEQMEKDNVTDSTQSNTTFGLGKLQEQLHRRKGTLTVIAEFKRKNSATETGRIKDVFDPELLSPIFREFGASGIAVMADERMGGCTYHDLALFVEEQRRASNKVPGPVIVINNDLIIDELQIARTAAYGAGAAVITLDVVGPEQCAVLLKAAKALDVESIVAVSTKDEAQTAIDLGARMLCVVGVDGIEEKVAVIDGLVIPEGNTVTTIANILAKKDSNLQEIEEAWAIRDKGFNCAWVGDVLYKSGSDSIESPGPIIRSIKSKSSLKWASPKAYSGRGEGAREYLGDILM